MNEYFKDRLLDGVSKLEYARLSMEGSKAPPGTVFIALSGKKQVGKDTATKILRSILESNGKRVAVTAFAEPLKSMCIDILGLNRELVYGTNEDKETLSHVMWDGFPMHVRLKYSNEFTEPQGEWELLTCVVEKVPRNGPMTVREVLQVMGTDIFRAIDNDVWARAIFNRECWSDFDVVILTDCRFPNEKDVTEYHNGVIIRLERQTGFKDMHPSETALDDASFDPRFSYHNDGSLEDLETFLRHTLKQLNLINGN